MYVSRLDVEHGLAVGCFFGRTNDDADYERYIESVREADRRCRPDTARIFVLVVERNSPPPSAKWRQRIAVETADVRTDNALFILCAESALIRGVVTAINWIRPPKYEVRIVSRPEDAIEIVRERHPPAAGPAKDLIASVRAEARALPSVPPKRSGAP